MKNERRDPSTGGADPALGLLGGAKPLFGTTFRPILAIDLESDQLGELDRDVCH